MRFTRQPHCGSNRVFRLFRTRCPALKIVTRFYRTPPGSEVRTQTDLGESGQGREYSLLRTLLHNAKHWGAGAAEIFGA